MHTVSVSDSVPFRVFFESRSWIQYRLGYFLSLGLGFSTVLENVESRIQSQIHLDMGRIPDSVPNLKKLVPQTSGKNRLYFVH